VEQKEQFQQEAARQMLARGLDDEDLRPGDIVSTENGEGISADNKRIFVQTGRIEA
jgi:hypothetical protein